MAEVWGRVEDKGGRFGGESEEGNGRIKQNACKYLLNLEGDRNAISGSTSFILKNDQISNLNL